MEFEKIVSVSGMPGLYQVIGQRANGLILEEIGNSAKKFATSARQKVSVLSDIAMFTDEDDVKLSEILLSTAALDKKGDEIPTKKDDDKKIMEAFEKVLPKYDKERVYTSDMKKLFGWYHILKGTFDFATLKQSDKEKEEASSDTKDKVAKTAKDGKPKKVASKAVAKTKTKTGSSKISKSSMPRKTS